MLSFLVANWRLFAVLGAVLAVFAGGEHYGASRIQNAWDSDKLKQQQEALMERSRIEASANQKTAEYQAAAKKAKNDLVILKRSLANVVAKDINLSGCNATSEFLSIYQGTPKGDIH